MRIAPFTAHHVDTNDCSFTAQQAACPFFNLDLRHLSRDVAVKVDATFPFWRSNIPLAVCGTLSSFTGFMCKSMVPYGTVKKKKRADAIGHLCSTVTLLLSRMNVL